MQMRGDNEQHIRGKKKIKMGGKNWEGIKDSQQAKGLVQVIIKKHYFRGHPHSGELPGKGRCKLKDAM